MVYDSGNLGGRGMSLLYLGLFGEGAAEEISIYIQFKEEKKTMEFKKMQEMYLDVVHRFNKIELNEWKAQGAMIELAKQVGELAKQVMLKEKYYAFSDDEGDIDERLGNEMADVIAQVIRMADYYDIDLEKAFVKAREDEDNYLKSRGV